MKCLEVCRKNAIKYSKQPVEFNPKRRDFIIAASTLAVFGGAIKAGLKISKNFAKKVRNIILPAGAKNANRMANKCLNCNLCIENCPNKILSKADSSFPAVHIDYSKGKGYCSYDCNKCSSICPTGAIERISLDEKQKTRIAMAVLKDEKCKNCGVCTFECPAGVISKINDKIIINSSKCTGCAKCAKVCRFDAIEIFALNEQKII